MLYLKPHELWSFPDWLLGRGTTPSPGWALCTVAFNNFRPLFLLPAVVFSCIYADFYFARGFLHPAPPLWSSTCEPYSHFGLYLPASGSLPCSTRDSYHPVQQPGNFFQGHKLVNYCPHCICFPPLGGHSSLLPDVQCVQNFVFYVLLTINSCFSWE